MDRQMLSTMRDSMMIDINGTRIGGQLWVADGHSFDLWPDGSGRHHRRPPQPQMKLFDCRQPLSGSARCTLLMGYSSNYHEIYILRAIMGISEALYPLGLSLIADFHTE